MIRYLGPPPKGFLDRCKRSSVYFDEQGQYPRYQDEPGYILICSRELETWHHRNAGAGRPHRIRRDLDLRALGFPEVCSTMGPNGKAIGHSTSRPQMAGWVGILTDDIYTCRHVLLGLDFRSFPSLRLFAPHPNAEHGMPNVGPTSSRKPKVMYNMRHFTRLLHSGETPLIRP